MSSRDIDVSASGNDHALDRRNSHVSLSNRLYIWIYRNVRPFSPFLFLHRSLLSTTLQQLIGEPPNP